MAVLNMYFMKFYFNNKILYMRYCLPPEYARIANKIISLLIFFIWKTISLKHYIYSIRCHFMELCRVWSTSNWELPLNLKEGLNSEPAMRDVQTCLRSLSDVKSKIILIYLINYFGTMSINVLHQNSLISKI